MKMWWTASNSHLLALRLDESKTMQGGAAKHTSPHLRADFPMENEFL